MLHCNELYCIGIFFRTVFKTIWLIWTRYTHSSPPSIENEWRKKKSTTTKQPHKINAVTSNACLFSLCKPIAIRMNHIEREKCAQRWKCNTIKKAFSDFVLIKYYFNGLFVDYLQLNLFKHWHFALALVIVNRLNLEDK